MKRYTGKGTPKSGKNTPTSVTPRRMWGVLKELEPHNTEKRLADVLSERGGEDISHRTVEGWRYKLPSGKHLFLILTTWPEVILRVTAQEISENQSRHQRLERALEELRHELNNAISTRDLWTKPEDSGGD